MISILEELKSGNSDIVRAFKECNELWEEILGDPKNSEEDALAKSLSSKQFNFERIVGDTYLGKVVMAWSGFSHLYDETSCLDDNAVLAIKLKNAFNKSMCSLEVKHASEKAAQMYAVQDYA